MQIEDAQNTTLTIRHGRVSHTMKVTDRAKMLAAFHFALGAARELEPVEIIRSDGEVWLMMLRTSKTKIQIVREL